MFLFVVVVYASLCLCLFCEPLVFQQPLLARFQSIDVHTRLLPLQILGKQASSTAFKAKSCLRMLQLESNTDIARTRVRSLLSDFGTESNLWLIPDFSDQGAGRCVEHCMPLSDIDHLLHHVMRQSEEAFAQDKELWPSFNHQIQAMAKFFSKKDHAEQYVQRHIYENDKIPTHAKGSIAKLFNTTCPTFCITRWHFGFEVLHWISTREALIDYLEPLSADDFSNEERTAIRALGGHAADRLIFWAVFWCYYAARS